MSKEGWGMLFMLWAMALASGIAGYAIGIDVQKQRQDCKQVRMA